MSFTEGSAIWVSTLYYLVMNVSPGAPGSRAITVQQSIINLAIMLFGELIVTDSLVAYFARNFSRYVNDPAREWAGFRKRRRLVFGINATISLVSIFVVAAQPAFMCYTIWVGEEDADWVITTCPSPPKNITELVRAWGEPVN